MYQSLYRKYRPKTFDEVFGQDVIIKTLTNAIKYDRVSHAYLFCGPRGTGKTSIAKIYAKMLNCEHLENMKPCNKCVSCTQINSGQNIDIIEIDAASNNGVDEIREIRNKVNLVASSSKNKIYIIDEVHMLTTQAFNALLKTLEEPPAHIIFILATTEPHKIPRTILSRCQRFDYKKVSNGKIIERLKYISEQENINIDEEALEKIAILSDGGMRDAISTFEQAISYSDDAVTLKDINDINGMIQTDELENLIIELLNNNIESTLQLVEKYDDEGKNIIKIVQDLIETFKNILLYFNVPNYEVDNKNFYNSVKEMTNNNKISILIKNFSRLLSDIKNSSDAKLLLEVELINSLAPTCRQTVDDEEKIHIKEPPKPQVQKKNEKVEINNISQYNVELLEKLKNIRINNSLVEFSKTTRETFIKELDKIKILLMNPEYSKNVSLILDGSLKSISKNYLMFVYKTNLLSEKFNLEIKNIEEIFKKTFNIEYRPIAISDSEWKVVQNKYNTNKTSYKYIEDDVSIESIFENIEETLNNEELLQNTSDIDNLFSDIVQYN